MTTTKGLTATILRPADGNDYSNNGISATGQRLTVIGTITDDQGTVRTAPLPSNMQVFEPTTGAPAAALYIRYLGGRPVPCLIPAHPVDNGAYQVDRHTMSGGNYASIIDSRFTELLERFGITMYGALAIHDRID